MQAATSGGGGTGATGNKVHNAEPQAPCFPIFEKHLSSGVRRLARRLGVGWSVVHVPTLFEDQIADVRSRVQRIGQAQRGSTVTDEQLEAWQTLRAFPPKS
jgi:hypothetical protein